MKFTNKCSKNLCIHKKIKIYNSTKRHIKTYLSKNKKMKFANKIEKK